jgi:hypothetical protein
LNPPTKVLGKFLRVWREREQASDDYFKMNPTLVSDEMHDPAGIALSLSKSLIEVVKIRNVVNIEAGLEMIALAMAISSEVISVNLSQIH